MSGETFKQAVIEKYYKGRPGYHTPAELLNGWHRWTNQDLDFTRRFFHKELGLTLKQTPEQIYLDYLKFIIDCWEKTSEEERKFWTPAYVESLRERIKDLEGASL